MMKKIDETDKKIIRMIADDWQQGSTKMGKQVDISHTAVRSRLNRMSRDFLKVSPHINLEEFKFKLFVICIHARQKSKVLQHVKNCPKILYYFDTYGEYNIMIVAVAENADTMESMIERCLSFNYTQITKYSVLPISNFTNMYQPLRFYSQEEKDSMHCEHCRSCIECTFHREDRCVGCPLHEGYEGIL